MKRKPYFTLGLAAVLAAVGLPICAYAQTSQLLSPISVAASSVLPASDYGTYEPENLLDYNADTAWVEGVSGNGEGQFVDFFFAPGTLITGGQISNGYRKSEDLFYKNSAPSSLSFQSGAAIKTMDLSEVALTYHSEPYEFSFAEPLVCDGTLRVSIDAVRAGWKYTDTCISELHFYGTSSGAASVNSTSEEAFESLQLRQNENLKYDFSGLAARMLERYYPKQLDPAAAITAEESNAEARALAFYWYQYFHTDSRIEQTTQLLNSIREQDILSIASELFGGDNEDMLNALFDGYVQKYSEGTGKLSFSTTGDFGAVGYWYFDAPIIFTLENDRLKVSGTIIDSMSGSATATYTAYYEYTGKEALYGWQFAEVSVK